MTLKDKAINGLFWSFIDSFSNQGIQFIVGIVLARILSPREFGLIGMLTIFIAISQAFVDSGFNNALVRKQNCTQTDYSTIFYFNIFTGFFFYGILFFGSDAVSQFFDEPQLSSILKVLGFGLIFNSFGIIQRSILIKNINFKLQTRISLIASISSGIIAITMAYKGFGVWSLVALTLSRFGFNSLFLWVWTKWIPTMEFSRKSFFELFSFGSKLLLSGLINTLTKNIYYLVIGKYFSAIELGYYTRADQFKSLPSQNLYSIIERVSYPLLSSIQHEPEKMKATFVKLIRSTVFVTFVMMLGMAAIAGPMIETLIGKKWLGAVEYLQLLCIVGMFYPLHVLNLNILKVLGRSDLYLQLEVVKKIMVIPVVVIGIYWGVKIMILGMIVNSFIAYFLNSYWSGQFIGYSIGDQISDIIPSFILAMVVSTTIFGLGVILPWTAQVNLMIQLISGAVLLISLCEATDFKDYRYIKNIVMEKMTFR